MSAALCHQSFDKSMPISKEMGFCIPDALARFKCRDIGGRSAIGTGYFYLGTIEFTATPMPTSEHTDAPPPALVVAVAFGNGLAAGLTAPLSSELEAEIDRRVEERSRSLHVALSSIEDFAYVFDRDGRFTYSSHVLLNLLDVTLDQIIGQNFFDLGYPPVFGRSASTTD